MEMENEEEEDGSKGRVVHIFFGGGMLEV